MLIFFSPPVFSDRSEYYAIDMCAYQGCLVESIRDFSVFKIDSSSNFVPMNWKQIKEKKKKYSFHLCGFYLFLQPQNEACENKGFGLYCDVVYNFVSFSLVFSPCVVIFRLDCIYMPYPTHIYLHKKLKQFTLYIRRSDCSEVRTSFGLFLVHTRTHKAKCHNVCDCVCVLCQHKCANIKTVIFFFSLLSLL